MQTGQITIQYFPKCTTTFMLGSYCCCFFPQSLMFCNFILSVRNMICSAILQSIAQNCAPQKERFVTFTSVLACLHNDKTSIHGFHCFMVIM